MESEKECDEEEGMDDRAAAGRSFEERGTVGILRKKAAPRSQESSISSAIKQSSSRHKGASALSRG